MPCSGRTANIPSCIHKEQESSALLTVKFHDADSNVNHYFKGPVTLVTFGSDRYVWHPNGPYGYPDPDGPAEVRTRRRGQGRKTSAPGVAKNFLSTRLLRRNQVGAVQLKYYFR
jgi:hypothetical protein